MAVVGNSIMGISSTICAGVAKTYGVVEILASFWMVVYL